jgi:hypothetical protein
MEPYKQKEAEDLAVGDLLKLQGVTGSHGRTCSLCRNGKKFKVKLSLCLANH